MIELDLDIYAAMRDALKFYGKKATFQMSRDPKGRLVSAPINHDRGKVARDALSFAGIPKEAS